MSNHDNKIVWTAKDPDGGVYAALFNTSDTKQNVKAALKDLDIAGKVTVRDLWSKKDIGSVTDILEYEVNEHGTLFLKLELVME